jgi:hypothetical protein
VIQGRPDDGDAQLTRTRISSAVLIGFTASSSLLGCSDQHQRAVADASRASSGSKPAAVPQASDAFTEIAVRYATCRTYKDRGQVMIVYPTQSGHVHVTLNRFDTIFVRNRGFRFRFFNELNMMTWAVWALNGQIFEWMWGDARSLPAEQSLVDDIAALRGATSLTSWVVPNLLFGLLKPESAPIYGSENNVLCDRCPMVLFHEPGNDSPMTLTLDLRAGVVRRFSVGEVKFDEKIASEPSVQSEVRIFYESPQLNIEESAIRADLERRPW